MNNRELIVKHVRQLASVCVRMESLALDSPDELYEEMFSDELMHAQKLIIEITKAAVGDEPDNQDEAFMPGELDDKLNEKEVSEE